MRSQALLLMLCGFASAVVNPTCHADNCLRAVNPSVQSPGSVSASKDCSSFFKKTVTPATVTQTATVTITQTNPTATTTHSNTAISTTQSTESDTTTVQSSTTLSVTSVTTITSTETVDVTVSSFITVYTAAPAPTLPGKREIAFDHKLTNILAARQQTIAPSSVPKYASACSGTIRYSSACSCIGVTQSTVTVAAPTTIITQTNTATYTPSATSQVTQTVISSVTITTTATSVVVNTITSTIGSSSTVDTTVSDSTTITLAVATATCTSFILQASGGGVDGQYISLPGTSDETVQHFTTDPSSAALFTLNGNGNWVNSGYLANTDLYNAGPAEIFFDPVGTFSGVSYLTCNTAAPEFGPFSCSGYGGAAMFQLCPSGCVNPNSEPCSGLSIATNLDSRCQAISFTALPRC